MPTTTYGPTTTAAEIVANVDLHGKRAVVTGASSGIGVETARALASTGAEVTLAVRNLEAGRKVADEIAEKLPSGAAAAAGRPAGLGRSRLSGRLCAQLERPVAHPGQQCRRDGPAEAHPHPGRV